MPRINTAKRTLCTQRHLPSSDHAPVEQKLSIDRSRASLLSEDDCRNWALGSVAAVPFFTFSRIARWRFAFLSLGLPFYNRLTKFSSGKGSRTWFTASIILTVLIRRELLYAQSFRLIIWSASCARFTLVLPSFRVREPQGPVPIRPEVVGVSAAKRKMTIRPTL